MARTSFCAGLTSALALIMLGLASMSADARSLGTPELQKDTQNTIVLHALVKNWSAWPKDCDQAAPKEVVVTEQPANARSGWKERWTMQACGARVDVDVTYEVAPSGGTLIRTNIAEKTSPDKIADAKPLVGLWTGEVVQIGVGKIETWLTFTSDTRGVSQYPEHACGGVLTGKQVSQNTYAFQEHIKWGGLDEKDDGCIDGSWRVTLKGDALELDFSATIDGQKETATGTLARFRAPDP